MKPSASSRVSAKRHGEAAADAFQDGDIVEGLRHLVQPFVWPAVSKAAEAVVRWRCLKCGHKF